MLGYLALRYIWVSTLFGHGHLTFGWSAVHRMCKFAWAEPFVVFCHRNCLAVPIRWRIGGVWVGLGWGRWPGSGFGFSAICAFDKGNKRGLWLLKHRRLLVDFVALFVWLKAIKYIQIYICIYVYTGECILFLFYFFAVCLPHFLGEQTCAGIFRFCLCSAGLNVFASN